jgi:hypothetical protein
VETPGTLPNTLYADGNAYRIDAFAQPGNRVLTLAKAVHLTLRYPRLPHGIEVYRDGSWTSLCTLRQSTYTPQTIACTTSALGTFLAVVTGPARRHSSSGSSLRLVPIAAGAVLLVVILAGVVVLLRRRRGAVGEAS